MSSGKPDGEKIAEKCIEGLKSLQCDPLILFWMRHMCVLDKTMLGVHLMDFARSQGVTVTLLNDFEFYNDFWYIVRREANKGVEPIIPSDIIRECGTGGKERALAALKTVKWKQPFQPFCFQTRGVGPSEFIITKTFQDGLIAIRDIYMATRKDTRFQYVQLIEHCWGDERMCRLIIDWEMEEYKLAGAFTLEEVKQMARKFPEWFAERLNAIGAIAKRNAGVRVIIKNKSRATDKGFKVSYHFIVNVVGIPKGSHQRVCSFVFQPWKQALAKIRTDRDYSSLDADDRRNKLPVWGVDINTLHGSQGFSTIVSRKLVQDPLANVEEFQCFVDSIPCQIRPYNWTHKKLTTEAMFENHKALSLVALYTGSYTVPSPDTIIYDPSFLREKVGSTLGLAVSSRNPLNTRSDPACSTLPEYLAKSLGQMEGFKQYTKSQCLDGVLNTLVRHLDVPKDQTTKFGVSRVTGCPCPVHLAKDPPQIHVHGSNGVFVVSQGDDVYLACSYCQLSAPPSKHVELVRGTESTRFNWFKYTEASWEKMMKDTKAVWLMKGRGQSGSASGCKRRKT